MDDSFDPYRKWLGIPPSQQPPNHYRLLGIELFESDPDVIDAASGKQVTYLQSCATGPYVAFSQRLLNEVAAARLCLLTPARKSAYDADLKQTQALAPMSSGFDDLEDPSFRVTDLPLAPHEPQSGRLAGQQFRSSRKPVNAGHWRRIFGSPVVRVVGLIVSSVLCLGLGYFIGMPYLGETQPQPATEVNVTSSVTPSTAPEAGIANATTEGRKTGKPFVPPHHLATPQTQPQSVNASLPPSVETNLSDKELSVDLGGGVKLDMVLIPAGEFVMGSGDSAKVTAANMPKIAGKMYPESRFTPEHPQHRVAITKPFYLCKYEVTQEQWQAVMGNNPSYFKGPKNPVEQVKWFDCLAFMDKLNATSGGQGSKFALPTEAQWEYACRAGSTTRFSYGGDDNSLGEYAWYKANSGDMTHPVGQKKPNAFGLYDMHGNVTEWCADWHGRDYFSSSPTSDPTGPADGTIRVYRSGSYMDDIVLCRSGWRGGLRPDVPARMVGFRVARVLVE